MPENNNIPTIPQEWITAKTLKTISGAALCCWMTTLFFDLICFMPIQSYQLHTTLVGIISTLSCLSLAIYKIFSSRSKKIKTLWMLVFPNAMLIYIHALGFQVATKELALRAYSNEERKETTNKAAIVPFFYFLTQQTSWIPDLGLMNKLNIAENQIGNLRQENLAQHNTIQALNEQIIKQSAMINGRQPAVNTSATGTDSTSYYSNQYKRCLIANTSLTKERDSLDNRVKQIISNYNAWKEQYTTYDKRDAILIKRIEDKNALINKWNQYMQSMQLPRAEIERQMNGYMGDENYYRKLFTPIGMSF
ncbi:hypothetical protein ACDQ55_12700 [Chitinophaga sp. 30R24]|uniref:hypothetical protein n=1 Tax=Chitinophaga sp. 30R24 TaxID=3248838 RepID=UPI003B907186